ncbi:hypothetical protein H072_11567 [Dactylellina haptotyla CBS 200.50]|uniref:Uncharacterized protein n=1 Tax=Dactylellina haptotyla (strain CBS 200.50) TaxID=1284197 RepID=S8A1P0_DACHA|nr:hypothetical protein H072_11567 [Dactylellina haptotyla CBS 200.50]
MLSDPNGVAQIFLLPGFSSLFNFLSFYEEFSSSYKLVTEIRKHLVEWAAVERNVDLPRSQDVSAALMDYAQAVGNFPPLLIRQMRALVGNLQESGPFGESWLDPETMVRYLFMITESNPPEVDDEWFEMLMGFLGDFLEGLEAWIEGLITAANRDEEIIRRLAPQPAYLESLYLIREDLGELAYTYAGMGRVAGWAYGNLTEFRQEIERFIAQDQFEQTLPGTPAYQGFQDGENYRDGVFPGGLFEAVNALDADLQDLDASPQHILEYEYQGTDLGEIAGDLEFGQPISDMEDEILPGPPGTPAEGFGGT